MKINKIRLISAFALISVLFLSQNSFAQDDAAQKKQQAYSLMQSKTKDGYKKALDIFTKLAKDGDGEAQYQTGMFYFDGLGVSKDMDKANKWFQKSGDAGYPAGQFMVGEKYYFSKKFTDAFNWYKKAADQGYEAAQLDTGYMLTQGVGVDVNKLEGLEWYKKAAAQGNASAMYNIGQMNENGEGIPADAQEAVKWYTQAAAKDHKNSLKKLVLIYYNSKGSVAKDYKKAADYIQQLTALGDKSFSQVLGDMYIRGNGVQKDVNKGAGILEDAFSGGQAYAGQSLGLFYYKGEFMPKDYAKAADWFAKSADKAPLSAFMLYHMYKSGTGVEKDSAAADKYYGKLTLAAGSGNKEAQDIVANLQTYEDKYK